MTQGYILRENLRAFVQALSWQVGPTPSSLSDEDWEAIERPLDETDETIGRRATIELLGLGEDGASAVIRYALMDPGSGIDYYVTIDVEAAPAVEAAAAAAIDIMQNYRLAPDPPYPWLGPRGVRVRSAT